MATLPSFSSNPELARLPAEVLEAYQRYRTTGDLAAVEIVVIAAAIDLRPSGAGPAPAVTDETRLVEDLGYDSVAVAELVFFIEDLFDVTISNEEILQALTIKSLRACIVRKVGGTQRKDPAPS
jgi:acyl carrier protein